MKTKLTHVKPEVVKLPPSKTLKCPNPKCEREHALFWYVGTKKRQLMYRCDRAIRTGKDRNTGNPMTMRTIAALVAPENVVPVEGIPEELAAPVVQKLQDDAQTQFPLMK